MCCNKTTISMNKRRSRARKSRKPKFLSLRHQFPPNQPQSPPSAATSAAADSRQLNLFPLHPENDREIQDQAENVALFFSSADGGDTSLTGLLDNSATAESISSHADNNSSRLDYLSPSSRYAYGEERAALVRNALRSRDRDSSEEKWVYYSEVVERKVLKEEEVSSSAVDRRPAAAAEIQRVSLKLDYEEIMNAWSNKGPLYIDAESCSQIVPDINHDFVPHENSSYNGVSWGCNVGLWAVPEMMGDSKNGEIRTKNNEDEIKNNLGTREASLLRYKEKRQNRLFSKKFGIKFENLMPRSALESRVDL